MEEFSLKNFLRFNNIKIRNKSLINQLSRDELIYCHLHCCANEEFIWELGGYDLPLSKSDFENVKSKINLKKVKLNKIKEDLLKCIGLDEESNKNEWFDTSVFTNKGLSEGNIFYVLFFSLMNRDITEVFRGYNKEKVADFLTEMSSFDKDDKPEYYVLKSLSAIVVLDNLRRLAEKDEIIDKVDSDSKSAREASEEFIKEIDTIQKTLVLCVYNNYSICCQEVIDKMSKESNKFEKELKKNSLQLEERNTKIKELKENIKELNKQLKDCQKIIEMSEIKDSIKNIEGSIKNIEMFNNGFSDEIKSMKKNIIVTSYENQIENYITRVSDLKKELSLKSLELKEIKKEFDNYKFKIEDNFIEHIKQNGVSGKVLDFIKTLETDIHNEDFTFDSDICPDSIPCIEEPSIDNGNFAFGGLGYTSIEDGIHYVNFINGAKEEIIDLSDKIFLAEGQFILVDEDYRLTKTTISKYEDNGKSISSLRLGIVESVDPLIIKVNNNVVENIKFDISRGFYKPNQVIALNDDNYIARAFRTIKFNADETVKSIKARGLDAYYVLDVFSNSFFKLRNIENGIEDIYSLETNGVDISKFSVVFVKDLTVVSVTAQSKFYTASTFYKEKVIFGPVIIENGVTKIQKQSGEISLVNNIPDSYIIDNGDVVAVDEFNNFLYVSNTNDLYLEKSMLKKTAKQVASSKDNSKPIKTKGEITIIGNLFYKNSYTMSFFKIGYKVNMLHGYDTSINKIVQTAKDSEAIIVNTSYCSHDNFWQIKDEVKDGALSHLKYIFTQEDGANMLVYKFNELQKQNEVAVTQ